MEAIADLLWSLGAACSATFVIYGGYLFGVQQCRSSAKALSAMARLALHDSGRVGQTAEEVKASTSGS